MYIIGALILNNCSPTPWHPLVTDRIQEGSTRIYAERVFPKEGRTGHGTGPPILTESSRDSGCQEGDPILHI
jgi:hypothetical protein